MHCHGNGCNWTTHPHLHADMLQPTPVPDPSTTSTSPGPPHFVSATCPQPGSSIAPYLQQPTCSYIALAAALLSSSDTGTGLQTFQTGQVTVCCNTTQCPYLLQLYLVLLNCVIRTYVNYVEPVLLQFNLTPVLTLSAANSTSDILPHTQ